MKRFLLGLLLSVVFLHCEDKTDWLPKLPEAISLSATSGNEGETLVITGKHFSATHTENVVLFDDVRATTVEATRTSITVIVPPGEGNVMIRVATKSLLAKKKLSFTYLDEITTPEQPETPEEPIPEEPTPEPLPLPEVTAITPSIGATAISITISGKNFSTTASENSVLFGTVPAVVTAASSTSLTVTVPAGTGSVAVSVTVKEATAANKPIFTYGPIVTSIAPTTAAIGTSIIITGTSFSNTPSENIVLFGNASATVTAASPTSLTVVVPPGGGSVPVAVTVNGIAAANKPVFNYPEMEVISISPSSGRNGTTITITGKNFSPTLVENTVLINGVPVPVITATATTLTVKAPDIPVDYDHACPTEVPVSVTVNGKEAQNKPAFTYRNPLDATAEVFAGDPFQTGSADGSGTQARFDHPRNIAIDDNDNLYVDDSNGSIRKITPAGNVSTIVTNGSNPDVDSHGNLYYTDGLDLYKRTPGGAVTLIATLPYRVEDLTVDNNGNVYILIEINHDINYIQKVSPNGTITVLAGTVNPGSADGQGANAQFNFSSHAVWWDMEYDEVNNLLYVIDRNGLRKVTMNGTVTTVYVSWIGSSFPIALAVDPFGEVYLNGNNNSSCKLQSNGDCCGVIDTDMSMSISRSGEVYYTDFSQNAIYKVMIP